ncbi:MAG: hypothetical protein QOC87_1503 [Actinomycetota bacterium]|nr:hypothetical protein [Actinomycetota bacterium]
MEDPEGLVHLGADIHLEDYLVGPDFYGANTESVMDRACRIRQLYVHERMLLLTGAGPRRSFGYGA